MKKHMKRMAAPREWPIAKKGTKYLTKPSPGKGKYAIPIILVIRDILHITTNKKETKRLLHEKNILVDNKAVNKISFPIGLFDIVSIPKINLYLRTEFSASGKLDFVKIKESEAQFKPCKIIGKKIIKGGKIQINLHDGRNFIYPQKTSINDSVLIDLKNNNISKHLPMKEKAFVYIIKGKHKGEKGRIESIEKNIAQIKTDSAQIKIAKENLFVLE